MEIFSLRKFLFLTGTNYLVSLLLGTQKRSLLLHVSWVAWQPIGISMGVYDMCHRYLKERKQFGAPLADFQLTQQKLVQMLGNIQAMILIGWRLCKMYEKGTITMGHVSLGKAWITSKGRETVSLGRELLGGNGILTDFLVAKAGKSLGLPVSSQLHRPNRAACNVVKLYSYS
ncbi:hypothetical protein ACSBR2_003325 [Camellia fascicularis]